MAPRRQVLLDANALFFPESMRIDLPGEIDRLLGPAEIRVPSSVLEELDRLVDRGVPGARTALAFARRFAALPAAGGRDEAILALAVRHRATVVTADKALIRRLQQAGAAVLAPRAGARLVERRPRPTAARATVKKRTPVRRRSPEGRRAARR